MRNIRFYHQMGILPRPVMRGRVGWYGEAHVERLGLIRRLQGRGYSLAAIADMIDNQVPAILLEEVDRSNAATAAWDGAEPSRVTRDQLEQMVPELVAEPAFLDRMTALRLLVPAEDAGGPRAASDEQGTVFDVPQPPLLRAGIALVACGVPVAIALDELEHLRAELGVVAGRFAEIVERDMLPAQAAGAAAPLEAVEELLGQVWPSVLVAIGRVLTDAMHEAVLARLLASAARASSADPEPSGGG